MNILIVGFGSIGQRHLQNLLENYPTNKYFVLKNSKHTNVLKDCKIVSNDLSLFYKDITFIDSIDSINKIDIAFICNNTSEHIQYALELSSLGTHLFIEKPLSNCLNGLEELNNNINKNNTILMLGYQTKFHPVYLKLKELLKDEQISFVNSKWLTYLPNWHPYEDYKERYAAKKSMGGGVALTLIHEIDMLNSLFDDLTLVNSISGNHSNLEIEADDYLSANFISNKIPIHLNLSFAQLKEERIIAVNTKNKTIVCDFISNSIEIYTLNSKKIEFDFKLKRNELFSSEVNYFFKSIDENNNSINTLKESIKLQNILNQILKSE